MQSLVDPMTLLKSLAYIYLDLNRPKGTLIRLVVDFQDHGYLAHWEGYIYWTDAGIDWSNFVEGSPIFASIPEQQMLLNHNIDSIEFCADGDCKICMTFFDDSLPF